VLITRVMFHHTINQVQIQCSKAITKLNDIELKTVSCARCHG
jgi:hypothetical protein